MDAATLVAGLGYGDEGKGTMVDWLAREERASLVVRYNGGAQAAHNVVVGDRHHTFAQLGSGTFAGVPTLLSRYMLVNPIALFAEARHLEEIGVASPLRLVSVEDRALVTTPLHVATNRLREMARSGRHGSCGMGIGETTADWLAAPEDALVIGDLADRGRTRDKLAWLRELKREQIRSFREALPDAVAVARELDVVEDEGTIDACLEAYTSFTRRVRVVDGSLLANARGHVVFEGAQGVLLDQDFGFQPHTTWTDITFANARALLATAGFRGEPTRVGVLRAYATRHGHGPFVSESAGFTPLSAHDHNGWGEWQHGFRSGAFDLVASRYALDVIGGVDELAITNVDRLDLVYGKVPVTASYEAEPDPSLFEGAFGRVDRIPVRRPFDLVHQERLTAALLRARPVNVPFSKVGYAHALAEQLGVSLRLTSHGPRAEDKVTYRNAAGDSVSPFCLPSTAAR